MMNTNLLELATERMLEMVLTIRKKYHQFAWFDGEGEQTALKGDRWISVGDSVVHVTYAYGVSKLYDLTITFIACMKTGEEIARVAIEKDSDYYQDALTIIDQFPKRRDEIAEMSKLQMYDLSTMGPGPLTSGKSTS